MIRAVARGVVPVLAGALAAHAIPAVTWIPAVRRLTPSLRGQGRPDHVALTFDDGPSRGTTVPLLELLDSAGVHATFFLVGQRVREAPGIGREIVDRGHEVAVHGWSHRVMLALGPRAARTELRRTRELIEDTIGVSPRWFRPPHGVLTGPAWLAARAEGLRPVLWGSSGWDWLEHTDPTEIARRVAERVAPGDTVLLHDAPIGASEVAGFRMRRALPAILEELGARGLGVGPLAEHGIR